MKENKKMVKEMYSSLFDLDTWKANLDKGKAWQYIFAASIAMLAAALRVLFPDVLALSTPFLIFPFVVFIAAYVGGLGPGLLALLITALSTEVHFLDTPFFGLPRINIHLTTTIYVLEGLVIVTLVSRLEKLIAMREEHERKKDDFISAASHELKTPLTSMRIFSELLANGLSKEHDEMRGHALQIQTQINRLTKLVTQMLDIIRLDKKRITIKNEEVNLGEIIQEAAEHLKGYSSKHRIVLEGSIKSTIVGDGERLSQVVTNLISNAIKYSPQGEKVIVRMLDGDDDVVVHVQDFGIGIDKAHHSSIFERFYRVSGPNEKTFPGLGIGLYISSEIIKFHGGKMWIDSEKGRGSTFSFSLPKADSALSMG